MSILDQYFEKYQQTTPEANPLGYQLHKDYTGAPVSKAGKIYWKRGRMHDGEFVKRTEAYYAVPMIYDQPEGFYYDKGFCWRTDSEMFVVRYYRKYGRAQHKLKKKLDEIIKGQDELVVLKR